MFHILNIVCKAMLRTMLIISDVGRARCMQTERVLEGNESSSTHLTSSWLAC